MDIICVDMSQTQKDFKEIEKQQMLSALINQPKQQIISTQSFSFYSQFFEEKFLINQKQQVESMYQKLRQNGFIISTQQPKVNTKQADEKLQQNHFQIKVAKKIANWQIVQLNCKYGIYMKNILVLNTTEQSETHSMKIIGIGSMGTIYEYRTETQNFAIKCTNSINKIESYENQILMALKQYFIFSIMSALKIGPKMKSYTGFDLLMSENCIQFSMELCQKLEQHQTRNNLEQQLIISLKRMHLLNIMHLDIKPSNIMFSKEFNKPVFIDFGMSELISEHLGFKTFTTFKGTAGFCGKDMLKCMTNPSYVDLYANDVTCLIEAFKNFKQIVLSKKLRVLFKKVQVDTKIQKFTQQKLRNILKFYLIKGMWIQGRLLMVKIKNDEIIYKRISNKILFFLIGLLFSQDLWDFFHQNCHSSLRTSKEYQIFIQKNSSNAKLTLSETVNYSQSHPQHKFMYFQKIYEKIQFQDQSFLCDFICRTKVKQILTDPQPSIQIFQYFNLLVKFLSFWNNIFVADLTQKYKVAVSFLTNLRSRFMSDDQMQNILQSHKIVLPEAKYFSHQLNKIMMCIQSCLAITIKNRQNQAYCYLFIDLLKQCVLLQIDLQQWLDQHLISLFKTLNNKNFIKKLRCLIGITHQIDLISSDRFRKSIKVLKQELLSVLRQYSYTRRGNFINNSLQQLKYKSTLFQNYVIYEKLISLTLKFCQNVPKGSLIKCRQRLNSLQNFMQLYAKNMQKLIETQTILQILIILLQTTCLKFCLKQMPKILKQFQILYKQFNQKNCNNNIIRPRRIKFSYTMANYSKVQQQIYYFDRSINCKQISEYLFLNIRIQLAVINNRQTQTKKYFDFLFNLQTQYMYFRVNQLFASIHRCIQKQFSQIIKIKNKIVMWMSLVLQSCVRYLNQQINLRLNKVFNHKLPSYSIIINSVKMFILTCNEFNKQQQKLQGNLPINLSIKIIKNLSTFIKKFVQFYGFNSILFSYVCLINLYYLCMEKDSYKSSRLICSYYEYLQKPFCPTLQTIKEIILDLIYSKEFFTQKIHVIDYEKMYNLIGKHQITVNNTYCSKSVTLTCLAFLNKQNYNGLFQLLQFLAIEVCNHSSQNNISEVLALINSLFYQNTQKHISLNISKSQLLFKFYEHLVKIMHMNKKEIWKKFCISIILYQFSLSIKQKQIYMQMQKQKQKYKLNLIELRVILKFIARSFEYLNRVIISELLNFYYYLRSITQSHLNKVRFILKKHVRNTTKVFSQKELLKLYFSKTWQLYFFKKSIFHKVITKKIIKFHKISRKVSLTQKKTQIKKKNNTKNALLPNNQQKIKILSSIQNLVKNCFQAQRFQDYVQVKFQLSQKELSPQQLQLRQKQSYKSLFQLVFPF